MNIIKMEQEVGSAKLYLYLGESFTQGNFYPSVDDRPYMTVAPGLPAIIALSIILTGHPIITMLVLNALAGALLVIILFRIGKELINITAGYIMALWSMFNFNMIRYGYQLLKEPYLFLLLSLIVLLMVRIYKGKKIFNNIILFSISFAFLFHIDDRYIFYLPIFLLFIIIFTWKHYMYKTIICWLIGIILISVPWSIRNYKQYDQLVILTPNVNSTLQKILGSNIVKTPKIVKNYESQKLLNNKHIFISENGYKYEWDGSFNDYLQSFLEYWSPSYISPRYVYTSLGWEERNWSLLHNLTGIIFYGIFIPFYVIGFIYSIIKKEWFIMFLSFLPFINSIMHTSLPFPLERYRLPFDFILILIALWFYYRIKGLKKESIKTNINI